MRASQPDSEGPARRDFELFYVAEYPQLVRVLVVLVRRWPLAEELAQEAMIAALRRWDQVRTMDRPDLWVRRVAVNRAVSLHRRMLAEVSALGRVPAVREVWQPEMADDRVWAAVRRLPWRQATAVLLTAVEGRTAAEVGTVLGCSEETARTHLRRARARLRVELSEDDDV